MWTFEANTKCNNMKYVWSHFYQVLVVLKYHRRLWANIFNKGVYLAFFGILVLLLMSVSKILTHKRLWYFKTTKILRKLLQTWFILLHLLLVWNVCVKSIWTHSAPSLCDYVIHGWSLMGTQLYWLFWEKGCLLIAVWWYALHTTGDFYSLTTNALRISGECQCI